MIRARESHDDWAVYACKILDRARDGDGFAMPEHIDWALSYLGDKDGSTKIPRDLMGRKHQRQPQSVA